MPPNILMYYIEREKNLPIKDRYYYIGNVSFKDIISDIKRIVKKD